MHGNTDGRGKQVKEETFIIVVMMKTNKMKEGQRNE
ncbi:uncharacterized protein G2W53_008965 [Senna tora]|uniref:Uncharacterized protein n=1 Tax=Senna tora TaxID=362788 RepID=A0A835C9G6_9FABA|nr:uncharacterized protein G2W53_008965 [Senna tora]